QISEDGTAFSDRRPIWGAWAQSQSTREFASRKRPALRASLRVRQESGLLSLICSRIWPAQVTADALVATVNVIASTTGNTTIVFRERSYPGKDYEFPPAFLFWSRSYDQIARFRRAADFRFTTRKRQKIFGHAWGESLVRCDDIRIKFRRTHAF